MGATLINPRESAHFNHRVESPRLWLREDGHRLGLDWSDSPRELFGDSFGEDIDSLFGSGACLLMDARLFRLVGGFTHGYFYGGEDVDLVLKLREQGRGFRYSAQQEDPTDSPSLEEVVQLGNCVKADGLDGEPAPWVDAWHASALS